MKRTNAFVGAIGIAALVLIGSCDRGPGPGSSSTGIITLASFNALHLGWDNGKDLARLANVLSHFDVVGLEEVMNVDTLSRVKELLRLRTGADWQYVISEQALGRTSYKEYYAVLYRSDRTKYVSNSAGVWNDDGDLFEREPFFASFKSRNFDYTIIVMHSDFDSNKRVMRREARLLYSVYTGIQALHPEEKDIILMGDFNLSANDIGWDSLKTLPTMTHLIPGIARTTLSPSGALSSAYDNIWIRSQFTGYEYADTSAVDYYYNQTFSDSTNPGLTARKRISDHVPVWARFRVDKPDDD